MSKNTNLSFLTDYITADITNGRIGINNASPTVAFDVTGAGKFSGTGLFQGATLTIGSAVAATNVKLFLNGVASKAAGIEFQQSGVSQWYLGNGAASEDNNFELYNSNGTMAMKIIKSTNAINFTGAATFSSSVTAGGTILIPSDTSGNGGLILNYASNASGRSWKITNDWVAFGDFAIAQSTTQTGGTRDAKLYISSAGNVGIGNTGNASRKLEVTQPTGYSAGIRIVAETGPGDAKIQFFGGGSSQMDIGPSAASPNDLIFGAGGAERMRITSGGQVQIGTTSGTIMSTIGLVVEENIVSKGTLAGIFTQNRPSTNFFGFYGSTNFIVYNSNVGTIGSFNATSGAYAGVSDINKKKDFEQSQIGLNEVLGLKPTLYRMKTEDGTQYKHLGFIAQEVKEFIPQAYSETGEGDDKFIGLTEMPIIAALVKAIQELSLEINLLKNK